MNQKQRDYAFGRITYLEDSKIKDVKKKFTTPAVKLQFQEKVELVRKGKVALKDAVGSCDYISKAFDFSKHEREESLDNKKADPIIEKIKNEAIKARDKIMLAVETEALAAILDFEKFIKAI